MASKSSIIKKLLIKDYSDYLLYLSTLDNELLFLQ